MTQEVPITENDGPQIDIIVRGRQAYTPVQSDLLDPHIIKFMQECEFWAEVSRHIKKVPTRDIPTAGIGYNRMTEEVTMFWNPEFVATLNASEINSLIKHEFLHLLLGHITSRGHTPGWHWNIAEDLAINSMLEESKAKTNELIPMNWCVPGRAYGIPKDDETDEDKARREHFSNLFLSFEKLKTSEYYYHKLAEDKQKNPGMYAGNEIETVDVHDWDQVPDDLKDFIKAKIRSYISKAQRRADQTGSSGWGDISSEMQAEIRRLVSGIVDWKRVLANFIGTLHSNERSTSIKRLNHRYPYIHPGTKRKRQAKLLIAIDQSGSVDDEQLEIFFSELVNLTRRVSVDILPFDCYADPKMIYTWKRGQVPKFKRVLTGGTDFSAPTNVVNDPMQRGQYDGFLIMTDGEAPEPCSSRVKRGWIISKGHKLLFQTDEIVINLDNATTMFGSWNS